MLTFTDVGIEANYIEDRTGGEPGFIFIAGCTSWEMAPHAAAFLGIGLCPICEGGDLRRKHYCLGCDRTGLDGRITFPGLEVDEAPDPEWHASASVYDPEPGLDGGVGKRVKIRRGVARGRKAG